MNYLILPLMCMTNAVWGLTKEEVFPKVTVRLVRRDWRLKEYDPGTDDPLVGFYGNFTELVKVMRNYKKYDFVSQPLIDATKLFDDPNYNMDQPSVILTHPLTVGDSLFITHTVGALATRNLQKHYNIFAMHAPWLSLHFQTSCVRTAFGMKTMFEPMAEAFATFLLDGINLGKIRPRQISFIGFSVSATINAYVARLIKQATRRRIHTLFALDAFQHNYNNTHFKQISAKDAAFVHIIHSSSRFIGTSQRTATVDIVLNNGITQPGCNTYFNLMGCSHRRSVLIFIFAVISAGSVVARQCDNWVDFYKCKCNDENGNDILIVSFPVNQQARGVFHVRTGEKLPYSLGLKGAYCKREDANVPFFIEWDD